MPKKIGNMVKFPEVSVEEVEPIYQKLSKYIDFGLDMNISQITIIFMRSCEIAVVNTIMEKMKRTLATQPDKEFIIISLIEKGHHRMSFVNLPLFFEEKFYTKL